MELFTTLAGTTAHNILPSPANYFYRACQHRSNFFIICTFKWRARWKQCYPGFKSSCQQMFFQACCAGNTKNFPQFFGRPKLFICVRKKLVPSIKKCFYRVFWNFMGSRVWKTESGTESNACWKHMQESLQLSLTSTTNFISVSWLPQET